MHPYVELARRALEYYFETDQVLAPPQPLSPDLSRPGAVFVSLYTADGQLRGCRGTISPVEPTLAEAIIRTAINSAVDDPRFPPMVAAELEGLKIKVDVLGPMQHVGDLSELDPKRYGILIQSGTQRSLLLPDIRGIDTVDVQLAAARRKAGIPPGSPIDVFKFSVERYS